jgi:hypothetical protein
VVRFNSAAGIVAAEPVTLDDFQVHGMHCRAEVVELVGWSQTYIVDISKPDARMTRRLVAFNPEQAEAAANLGHLGKEQVIDLDGGAAPGEFQLVVARVSRRVRGGIEHHTVSRLIRRASLAAPIHQIVASLNLFEGVSRETGD